MEVTPFLDQRTIIIQPQPEQLVPPMRVRRSIIRMLLVAGVLSSGAQLAQGQALEANLDSALVHAVGRRTRIYRADRVRPRLEGSPQFIHDSTLTVLLPDDELTTVPLSRIVRIEELERMKPANQVYFKFGGIMVGAIAGAIIGHNVGKTSQRTGFGDSGPRIGSVIGAIGGALVGGIIGSAAGAVSHPKQRWVMVYRR